MNLLIGTNIFHIESLILLFVTDDCSLPDPKEQREQVENITLDMANSMYSIACQSFPKALQIIDRFHVQKLMHEALQDLRIQYRWQAMDEENKAIKQAKGKAEEYTPARFENGDMLKQLLARSRYLLFKSPDKWSKSQEVRANILFQQYDDLKQFYYLTLHSGKIYSTSYDKNVARTKLALWFQGGGMGISQLGRIRGTSTRLNTFVLGKQK